MPSFAGAEATAESSGAVGSSNTLSGGSAAFLIIALILGNLAQPPGALVVAPNFGSWRVWRLAPLFCGLEGLTILLTLITAPFEQVSQRERAFTILAQRTTTSHDEKRPLATYLDMPKLELVWPMMLQIWKVVFIRGSKITTVLAVLYWIDWAAVQYCHCWVWFRPFTERTPLCRHGDNAEDFNVCQIDWVGPTIQNDNMRGYVKVSKALAWISGHSFVSFLAGWSVFKLFKFLAWLRQDAHWSWYALAPIGTIFYVLYLCLVILVALGIALPNLNLSDGYDLKSVRQILVLKSFLASFNLVAILVYYKFFYEETGTYKPAWLDWFG
jgi:hypothetical protein